MTEAARPGSRARVIRPSASQQVLAVTGLSAVGIFGCVMLLGPGHAPLLGLLSLLIFTAMGVWAARASRVVVDDEMARFYSGLQYRDVRRGAIARILRKRNGVAVVDANGWRLAWMPGPWDSKAMGQLRDALGIGLGDGG